MHRFPLLWQRALSPPVTQVTGVASISFSFVPHSPLCSPWGFPWTVYLGWVVAGDALSSVAAARRLPWWADLFLTCPPPTLTPNPSRPGLPWPTPPFAPASCPGNRREAWPGASLGPCLVPGHPCVRPRCMSKRFVLTSHYFLSRPSGGGATPLLAFVLFSSRKFFAADVAHGCPPGPPPAPDPRRGRVAGSPEDRALLIGCETFQPDPGWGRSRRSPRTLPRPARPQKLKSPVSAGPGDLCRHSNGVSRRGTEGPRGPLLLQ